VPIGHGRNHRFLILEVTVDQPNANSGLAADVMHAGLVKPALGEANKGCVEDLGAPIWN
jgi:hypothetical protein